MSGSWGSAAGRAAVTINGQKFTDRTISRDLLGHNSTLRLGKKAVRIHWSE